MVKIVHLIISTLIFVPLMWRWAKEGAPHIAGGGTYHGRGQGDGGGQKTPSSAKRGHSGS